LSDRAKREALRRKVISTSHPSPVEAAESGPVSDVWPRVESGFVSARPVGPPIAVPAALPHIPLVRAKTIEHLPEMLEGMNVRFEDLLKQTGLPDIPLDREDSFLPFREVLALIEAAARATQMEHFGLVLATIAGFDALGSYGLYIKRAPMLREAIRRADLYISWHSLGARLSLKCERSMLVWSYDLSPAAGAHQLHACLFALTLMRNVIRLAAGASWLPDELRLRGAPIKRPDELQAAFGERIVWRSDMNALVFPETLLAQRMAADKADRPTSDAAASAFVPAPPLPDFISTLKQLVRSFLAAGYPSAASMAQVSGHSLRSFQRHLALAGLSYSNLVGQVRLELAFELMRDPAVSLTDIGLELGYSDSANFTRAFKRWTGLTPHLFRQSRAV
jgi:AraC-like DNA-binding protein